MNVREFRDDEVVKASEEAKRRSSNVDEIRQFISMSVKAKNYDLLVEMSPLPSNDSCCDDRCLVEPVEWMEMFRMMWSPLSPPNQIEIIAMLSPLRFSGVTRSRGWRVSLICIQVLMRYVCDVYKTVLVGTYL